MGIYYYIVSHEDTKSIVERGDLDEIDKYVKNPKQFVGRYDGPPYAFETPPEFPDEHKFVEGAYQIASRAVELGKEDILQHIGKDICFDWVRDGNSYDLFVLATEKQQFHMIDVLWEIACENGYQRVAENSLHYSLKRLLGYTFTDNFKHIDEKEMVKQLPRYVKGDIILGDAYNRAKSLEKQEVLKEIENLVILKIYQLQNASICVGVDEAYGLRKTKKGFKVIIIHHQQEEHTECHHERELSDFMGGSYRWGDWTCDICSKEGNNGKRWLCKICNSDICMECEEKNSQ